MFTIAIQPARHIAARIGEWESSSARWAEYATEAGHNVKFVDVYGPDVIADLRGCDGFMWKHAHVWMERTVARRVLPAAHRLLGLELYPDFDTYWHYDDKAAQAYALEAAGVPHPRTWVYSCYESARDFLHNRAQFPLVLKLSSGAQSANVRLLHSTAQGLRWIDALFHEGVFGLDEERRVAPILCKRRLRRGLLYIAKGVIPMPDCEMHRNYVLFQEFLAGNAYDTRVVVIGRRAYSFRRHNRPGDFRASGSGRCDCDQSQIDMRFVRLGFMAACALRMQSVAIDGLYRHGEPVTAEVSYTCPSWLIEELPGHWELVGDAKDGEIVWRDGKLVPERAQMDDFLDLLAERALRRGAPTV